MGTNAKKVPELPAGKAGEALVELWRKRLDPSQTSVKQFIEGIAQDPTKATASACGAYRVPTKRSGLHLLLGQSALVPFREYESQAAKRETIEYQWRIGQGGKAIDGKPRQEGHTTSALLLFWERFMRGGGGVWNIFSYDIDATKDVFRLFASLRRQTPAWVFHHLVCGGGGVWKKSSSLQLELVFPDGNSCMLQCFTAGDKSSGSGSAPRGVLFDEFSKWKPAIKQDPTSMSEGWADAPGNVFIIQATGQGNEEFADTFMAAWDAPGHQNVSGFVAKFHSWLGHPDRRVEFGGEEERAAFAATIGKEKDFGCAEEDRLVAAGAEPEELLWRRQKLASPFFRFNLDLFSREYPLVPEDMFLTFSNSIFKPIERLKAHQAPAHKRERAAAVGEFEFHEKGVRWAPSRAGRWVLFEPVQKGGVYVFGMDTSSGKTKIRGSTKEPDFTVACFKELWTGRTVARFRAHVKSREGARAVFQAAVYFNEARGFIERNNFGEAVVTRFEDEEWGDVLGSDLLLHYRPPTMADGVRPQAIVGVETTQATRPIIVDLVQEFVDEMGAFDPAKGTPYCAVFVDEALRFEMNEKGKAEATTGHDDAVFAEAFAALARREVFKSGDVPLKSKVDTRTKSPDELMMEHWRQCERQPGRRDPVLGSAFALLAALTSVLSWL